jgi:site-specific DNA-methyltransferase (adenine-specific)
MEDLQNNIILGDCLDVLRTLENNSVDSICVDPPYGISFMGKKWDYDVPQVEVWKECLRVLKPGGHALIACGTRTQHRMAVNLEDAGFEIRDIVAWVYSMGFPKSLNIGKNVDKLQGNEREDAGKYLAPDGKERGGVANNPMDISNYKAGDRSEHNITKGKPRHT